METFKCSGCGDPVHFEELVNGRCPLCGEQCGPSSEFTLDPAAERERWVFTKLASDELEDLGLSNSEAHEAARGLIGGLDPSSLGGEESVVKRFRWRFGPRLRDYVRPKNCTFCNDRHFLIGAKLLEGILDIDPREGSVHVDVQTHWVCRDCLSRTPRSALGEAPRPPQ